MIGAREFALMQPHAYFITTARGFIHDEDPLWLTRCVTGASPAQVLTFGPKNRRRRTIHCWQFDNVLASPHTAGVTREARENMGRIAAEQMLAAFDGKRPPRIINPEVWPAYAKRFERGFGFTPE